MVSAYSFKPHAYPTLDETPVAVPLPNRTLVVSLFAGPGSGKSTTAAGVFYRLKMNGYNVEYVQEYAKDLTWEKRHQTLGNQAYIFGKQTQRVERLLGQVDAVICDGPAVMSPVYAVDYPESFARFCVDMHCRQWHMNYWIERVKPYNPAGRNQDEAGAREMDRIIREFLDGHSIPYEVVPGNPSALDTIYEKITHLIKPKIGATV